MHSWGDDWTHWDDLYIAEKFIRDYVYRWSRCRLISKEKLGTLRYQWIFPPRCLWMPTLFHLWKNVIVHEKDLGKRIIFSWDSCWLYRKWSVLGYKVLKRAVFKAIKKWPHIRRELLQDLAIHEELVGEKIHKEFWK